MALSKIDAEKLELFKKTCKAHKEHIYGYPCSTDYDYGSLSTFLSYSINNAGNCMSVGNYLINSFSFEREVVEWFSILFNLPLDLGWGYTTNGGTEGNLQALYMARERLDNPILLCSKAVHYSIDKIAKILSLSIRKIAVNTQGEIDYESLTRAIKDHQRNSIIIVLNFGSTMVGAYDSLSKINTIINDLKLSRDRVHIHADAALGGFILPFVSEYQEGFFDKGLDSLSLSGHKVLGSPIPCGLIYYI
ncbi:aminotransferase class I/II-fold pyridoxal phosphate-dependent enzyme [Zooshikella ganghwensis]|uniref:aminotransferase class I/II-fold pyridoxal phosphate-dependent enzyme n=1 Tax=Zooshikella ganghwensis TaxID=202772 RepID=UPI0004110A0D|nr:aminotransferase class I/II-fold pyridoxal phosphate-dependent enzyme [Zooshikella ganghwensis]